ncbi:hypothetical protein MKW92_030290 [Papaver armeniacum]|nr:hypothetical protein MKW92_030290 [Papaver armeniacum]
MAKKRKLPSTSAPKPSKEAKKEEPPPQQEEEEEEEEQIEYNPEEEIEEEVVAEEEEEVDEEVDEEEEEVEEDEEEEGGDEEEETLKDENNSNTVQSVVGTSSNGDGNGENEEDNVLDDEEEVFENLIEPFTKTQLSDLLKEAAEKHPDVLESIRKLADVDPVHRKIFVHGLGWDTTAETLISVFKKYGEIEDCKAVCDKVSGKSKGYAFILFKRRSSAKKALKEPQKKIGNRMTACQLASAGPAPAPAAAVAAPPVSEYTARKIYVSNVGAEVDPQKLLAFFSRFGEIEEGPLGWTNRLESLKGLHFLFIDQLRVQGRLWKNHIRHLMGLFCIVRRQSMVLSQTSPTSRHINRTHKVVAMGAVGGDHITHGMTTISTLVVQGVICLLQYQLEVI